MRMPIAQGRAERMTGRKGELWRDTPLADAAPAGGSDRSRDHDGVVLGKRGTAFLKRRTESRIGRSGRTSCDFELVRIERHAAAYGFVFLLELYILQETAACNRET
jgi:hypothetical protein